MSKPLTNRVTELERSQLEQRRKIAGLVDSLDEMGRHYDALLDRMGIVWPEVDRDGGESDSGSPCILPAGRLKPNRLGGRGL